jgi:hypothetical protein
LGYHIKTLPDLIALAKQKPGELSYGVNGIGRLTCPKTPWVALSVGTVAALGEGQEPECASSDA